MNSKFQFPTDGREFYGIMREESCRIVIGFSVRARQSYWLQPLSVYVSQKFEPRPGCLV